MFKKVGSRFFSLVLSIVVLSVLLMPMYIPTPVYAAGNTYYVATNGNDTTGNGSIGNPWKTIQKAATQAQAGDTVIIRAGTYREAVTPSNSGTAGNPITYKNYTGETVTINGCDQVTGWSRYSGNIYKAASALAFATTQVFVSSNLMTYARYPNNTGTFLNPTLVTDANVSSSTVTGSFGSTDWTGARVFVLSGSTDGQWKMAYENAKISSYNSGTHTITVDTSSTSVYWGTSIATGPNSWAYISGSLACLDAANEWYQNSSKYLYLYAPGGGVPSGVEARRRDFSFDISGKSYINIQGINFFACRADLENSTCCTVDSCGFKYVSSCVTFKHAWPTSFWMLGDPTYKFENQGIFISGDRNTIKNCTVQYSDGDGISCYGTNARIYNNIVHDIGYMGTDTAGIVVAGYNNIVEWNSVYDCFSAGISNRWLYMGKIVHNEVYNVMTGENDRGAIYASTSGELKVSRGVEIAYNKVHDTEPYKQVGWGIGIGIYQDGNSFNINVHHNLIYNCRDAGGVGSIYLANDASNGNCIYNNTIDGGVNIKNIGSQAGGSAVEFRNNIVTGTNYNTDTVDSNNIWNANPSFVDKANHNYQLQSGSLAIDSGITLPPYTDSYTGHAPDAGCFEYGVTAWSAGANQTTPPPQTDMSAINVTNVPITSGSLTWNGTWSTDSVTNSYTAQSYSEKYTTSANAYVQYSFTGNCITFRTSTGTDRGIMDVYLDGAKVKTIDLYGGTTVPNYAWLWPANNYQDSVTYELRDLARGSHTIKLVCTGTKNSSSSGYRIGVENFTVLEDTMLTAVDDDGANITYGGGTWTDTTRTGSYQGTERYINTQNAYAQFTFTGTAVRAISTTDSNRGDVDVYIDGIYDKTVSGYTPSLMVQREIYCKTGLSNRQHTLKLVNKYSNAYLDIDAFEYYDPTKIDDLNKGLVYSGIGWESPIYSSIFYGGSETQTNDTGDYVEYTFIGTGVKYISTKDTNGGYVDIYIDGTLDATVDPYNGGTLTKQVLYSKTGLSSGKHTIRCQVNGGKNPSSSNTYMKIDYLEITPVDSYTLFTDNFDDNSLGSAWTTYGGTWSESGKVLSQTSTANGDPRKAIVSNGGVSTTADQEITARVRVDSWTDGDYARAGVGLYTSTSNGYGYNLVFHNDHSTVQFLDDNVAWGPSYTFTWTNGTWYWFKLKMSNGTLYGKVWQDGTAEPVNYPYSWTRSSRTGYPALNGGSTYGGSSTASFDDVRVSSLPPPIRVDNMNGAVYHYGSWYDQTGFTYSYNNNEQQSNVTGNYVEFTFNGTAVKYIAAKDSNRGYVDIYIDGTLVTTVDGYNAGTLWQQTIYSGTGLSSGQHTIKCTINGSKNPSSSGTYAFLDYFEYTPDDMQASSQTLPVRADNEYTAKITYSGSWTSQSTGSPSYRYSEHQTNATGAYFEFTFTGTGVKYVGVKDSNRGYVDISIDGTYVTTVDGYNAGTLWQQAIYSVTGLADGQHTIRCTINGSKNPSSTGTYAFFDYFEYTPTSK